MLLYLTSTGVLYGEEELDSVQQNGFNVFKTFFSLIDGLFWNVCTFAFIQLWEEPTENGGLNGGLIQFHYQRMQISLKNI